MNIASLFKLIIVVPLLLMVSTSQADRGNSLNIAIAANFLPVFSELKPIFETQTGIELVASSGSTGQLYHQIRFGAPYDLFLSADEHTSLRLISEGLADASSYFIYGQGRLVLWSLDKSLPLDDAMLLKTYANNIRIAIANPKIAPYGKAAQEVLANDKLDKRWQNNLITGQNISQTYQFIASRNADVGFISLAQLRFAQIQGNNTKNSQGNYWFVPKTLHQPIKQTAVLLKDSKVQATKFLDFLKSPIAVSIMQKYGYEH